MGNSALCGDCCVDCFPWLLKKRRRLTLMIFGFDKCGKTPFIHKAIRMKGGTVLNPSGGSGGDSANFSVETLDIGEKTRLELFDIAGDKDSRVLWPTYFNFGINGLVYVIDGSAPDEVIEENIKQLIFLIQHDAIVKPRNSHGRDGEIRNPDGTTTKDLSMNEERKENEGITGDREDYDDISGDDEESKSRSRRRAAATREYYDTPVAIIIDKTKVKENGGAATAATTTGAKNNGKNTNDEKYLTSAGNNGESNNRGGKFASQLCSKFSLQDRILSAVRTKIAATLLTPKKVVAQNPASENDEVEMKEPQQQNGSPKKSGKKSLPPPFPVNNPTSSNPNINNPNLPNSPTHMISKDDSNNNNMTPMESSTSNNTKQNGKIKNVQDSHSPITIPSTPPPPAKKNQDDDDPTTSDSDHITITTTITTSIPRRKKASQKKNQNCDKNADDNNNSFDLPSEEAIPFDAHVNCGGFRWQVFEVNSVNGENVLNSLDWITNAMLRGKKP